MFETFQSIESNAEKITIYISDVTMRDRYDNNYNLEIVFFLGVVDLTRDAIAKNLILSSEGNLIINSGDHLTVKNLVVSARNIYVKQGMEFNNSDHLIIFAKGVLFNEGHLESDNIVITALKGIINTTTLLYKQYNDMNFEYFDGLPYVIYSENKEIDEGAVVKYVESKYAVTAYDFDKTQSIQAIIKVNNKLEIKTNYIENFYGKIEGRFCKST